MITTLVPIKSIYVNAVAIRDSSANTDRRLWLSNRFEMSGFCAFGMTGPAQIFAPYYRLSCRHEPQMNYAVLLYFPSDSLPFCWTAFVLGIGSCFCSCLFLSPIAKILKFCPFFWSNSNDYHHNLTIWKPTFSAKLLSWNGESLENTVVTFLVWKLGSVA